MGGKTPLRVVLSVCVNSPRKNINCSTRSSFHVFFCGKFPWWWNQANADRCGGEEKACVVFRLLDQKGSAFITAPGTHAHTRARMHTHTHMRTHTHERAHTHTRAHTCTRALGKRYRGRQLAPSLSDARRIISTLQMQLHSSTASSVPFLPGIWTRSAFFWLYLWPLV